MVPINTCSISCYLIIPTGLVKTPWVQNVVDQNVDCCRESVGIVDCFCMNHCVWDSHLVCGQSKNRGPHMTTRSRPNMPKRADCTSWIRLVCLLNYEVVYALEYSEEYAVWKFPRYFSGSSWFSIFPTTPGLADSNFVSMEHTLSLYPSTPP